MGRRYGAAPVVVRFRHEDGEVIHVVSHFVRQMATFGPKVAAAAKVGEISGLSDGDKASFAKSDAAKANCGDVESSYAFQKMTTNLVVGKQRRNAELDRAYDMTVSEVQIGGSRGAPSVAPGARLKVLGRTGDKVQVRDDLGNELELPAAAVVKR